MLKSKSLYIGVVVSGLVSLLVLAPSALAQGLSMADLTVVAPAQDGEGLKQVVLTSSSEKVTVREVARLMESDPELVAALNDRSVDSLLKLGEQLTMPSRGWVTHTVRSGDTLWDLAQTYGISVEEIMAENEMGLSTVIVPGQHLTVPLSGASVVMARSGESTEPTTKKPVKETSEPGKTDDNGKPVNHEQDPAPTAEEEDGDRLADTWEFGVAKDVLAEISWPLKGYISSAFGPRAQHNHEGVDIAAPQGEYIKAALPGQVVFAGPRGTYGNAVILKHSSGVRTLYAHASRLLVNPGQKVQPGQVIALVGSTGHSTGPHVHFEVLFKGLPLNPLEFLP